MVDSAYTLYEAPYRGPSQESLDTARATLKEAAAAVDDQRKRAIIHCEACDTPAVISKWTAIDVMTTVFGPYERDEVVDHRRLECPSCEFQHRLSWTGEIDKYLTHAKRRQDHD